MPDTQQTDGKKDSSAPGTVTCIPTRAFVIIRQQKQKSLCLFTLDLILKHYPDNICMEKDFSYTKYLDNSAMKSIIHCFFLDTDCSQLLKKLCLVRKREKGKKERQNMRKSKKVNACKHVCMCVYAIDFLIGLTVRLGSKIFIRVVPISYQVFRFLGFYFWLKIFQSNKALKHKWNFIKYQKFGKQVGHMEHISYYIFLHIIIYLLYFFFVNICTKSNNPQTLV